MAVLVDKKVPRTLFSMAFPMLAGTFAMNAYNLTDTWFISRLGTLSLAAMGFTLPVVMLWRCVAHGIGSGVTTLVSHAMGRDDREDSARLLTHGIILSLAVTVLLSVAGYVTIEPVFRRLGANQETLPLIGEYMRTWYVGSIFLALPMLGNGILIAAGDSKSASLLMILGTVLNTILDPIMIFGLGGCPAMGIRGAALATVIAHVASTLWLVWLLRRKYRLLTFHGFRWSAYLGSVRRIKRFAVPSILSMILMPVSATIITRILSGFGKEAVAGSGAAGRIEMFAFVIPMALGISLTPFVSQNFGAERLDRVREAHKVSVAFALGYGAIVACLFVLAAPQLASIFSDDPKVVNVLTRYIRIISFGYGMMEVHRYSGFFLTGLHRPVFATVLNVIRVLVLLIPLSCLGARLAGVSGVFWGRLLSDLTSGSIGLIWVSRTLNRLVKGSDASSP